MRKILTAALAVFAVIIAFSAGTTFGINHVLTNAEFTAENHTYSEPTGEYAMCLRIDLDGDVYEQGMNIQ